MDDDQPADPTSLGFGSWNIIWQFFLPSKDVDGFSVFLFSFFFFSRNLSLREAGRSMIKEGMARKGGKL